MQSLSISLCKSLPLKAFQGANEFKELVRLDCSQHPAEHRHHLTTTDLDGVKKHAVAINFIVKTIACKGFAGCDMFLRHCRLSMSQHPAEHGHHLTATDLDGEQRHANAINFIV